MVIGWGNPGISPAVSSVPSPSKTSILPTEYLNDPLNGMVVQADCIAFGNISAQQYKTVQQGDGIM